MNDRLTHILVGERPWPECMLSSGLLPRRGDQKSSAVSLTLRSSRPILLAVMVAHPLRSAVLVAALVMGTSLPAHADADADKALHAFLAAEWEYTLEQAPTWASSLGDHRFDDRWEDQSLAAIEARHAHTAGRARPPARHRPRRALARRPDQLRSLRGATCKPTPTATASAFSSCRSTSRAACRTPTAFSTPSASAPRRITRTGWPGSKNCPRTSRR